MISIILPIFNVEKYIEASLLSIMKQTYKDIEIICVNDFTPDNSMTIVKEYAAVDNRIRIINNPRNLGLGGARNAGLEAARGDYIIFVDSDDTMEPKMAERLLKKLEADDSDMVFCNLNLLYPDGKKEVCLPMHNVSLVRKPEEIYNIPEEIVKFTYIWPSAWNKIYKKSIIDKAGLKYRENTIYEDNAFYYDYLLNCKTVSYLPQPLYNYRHIREGQIMRSVSPSIFDVFTVIDDIRAILGKELDSKTFSDVMCRLTLRLVFERVCVMDEKSPLYSDFMKKAYHYLAEFSHRQIKQNRDWFIEKDHKLLESRLKRAYRCVFSLSKKGAVTRYRVFGFEIKRKDKIKKLMLDLDEVMKRLSCLEAKFEKTESRE